MAKRTPPFKNYPQWTTARFFGFIRSGLREKFGRYPVKYEAIKDSAQVIDTGEVYKTGPREGEPKMVKMYECCECNNLFRQKDIQVDHIKPTGRLQSFEDLGSFAERMFCAKDGLQIMCTECHKEKTQREKTNVKEDQ